MFIETPLVLFAFSATATPGPNNIMVMTSGLNFGVKRTMPHYMGVCIGFPAMVAAVGMGLGGLFQVNPSLHQIIKFAGISYLLFLAWKIARAGSTEADETATPLTFFQAASFQWVNPKAWVIIIGAVSTFTDIDKNMPMQVAGMVTVFFCVGLITMGSWMSFGVVLKRIIQSPVQLKVFNITMALLLVASIIPMLFTSAPVK